MSNKVKSINLKVCNQSKKKTLFLKQITNEPHKNYLKKKRVQTHLEILPPKPKRKKNQNLNLSCGEK